MLQLKSYMVQLLLVQLINTDPKNTQLHNHSWEAVQGMKEETNGHGQI